jgi:MoxR-like ATPase
MPDQVRQYIVKIIDVTRNPLAYSKTLHRYLREGIGPRGTFSLELGARGVAWLQGKKSVEISDVKEIIYDVLNHRLLLTEDAQSEGVTPAKIIEEILKAVEEKK